MRQSTRPKTNKSSGDADKRAVRLGEPIEQPSQIDPSMQSRIYEVIRLLIGEGQIRPGQHLLQVQIAKAFGVSRSPARIALNQLHDAGILQLDSANRFVVSGRPKKGDAGQVATLDKVLLNPAPRWEPIYAKVESDLCTRILFRPVRFTEERLAEHFGVSRTVAREALGRLHNRGLVSKTRTGRWIAEQMSLDRALELCEVRQLLEPHALIQSIPNIPRASLLRMEKSLRFAAGRVKKLDSKAVEVLDNELHTDLLSHCQNKELLRMIETTHILFAANRYIQDVYHGANADEFVGMIEQHLAILHHALKGDLEQAAEAMRFHLQYASDIWSNRYNFLSALPQPDLPSYFTEMSDEVKDADSEASVGRSGIQGAPYESRKTGYQG